MPAKQLSFDLPQRPAMGREAFFVAPSNAEAVGFIDNYAEWPGQRLLIIGPAGSGKSHLTHVWATASDAQIINARDIEAIDLPTTTGRPLAIEDIEQIAQNSDTGSQHSHARERLLFHIYNMQNAACAPLLLTSRVALPELRLKLPDLVSRLQSITSVHIAEPDDLLLSAVLMKLFADRQLRPTPETIPYLVPRIDRSFESARQIVDKLDQVALSTGRTLNRALARDIFNDLSNG